MRKLIENSGLPLMVGGWFIAIILACFIYVFFDTALWLAHYLNITLPLSVVILLAGAFITWRILPRVNKIIKAAWVLTKELMS